MNGSGDPSRRGRRRQGSPATGGTFDQWMVAGRQLVNGVSGARPGSRAQARGAGGRAGARPGLDDLGRWVGERFDWFLEGDDDWPEPWQERPSPQERDGQAPPPRRGSGLPADEPFRGRSREPDSRSADSRSPISRSPRSDSPGNGSPGGVSTGGGGRRPLEAISRRSAPLLPPASDSNDWPEDDNFRLPRWQRPSEAPAAPPAATDPAPTRTPQRPLPRSSRRRD
ncbi:hypothetical protein KBY97_05735 [Synechococcus sp. ATX 2A4]|uniref:hypothetical protein n=1 Tax=Synechococcus sp. ATX 2A4 TaxID=2823727 RepID=UPI0020CC6A73|nr:hypothetical protein [Synechococcus sp. ATX 2A4]MCP9884625.1 hypothetical protein [Synechococcus sp. ATX 2A4]